MYPSAKRSLVGFALALILHLLVGCVQTKESGWTYPGASEPWAARGEQPKVSVRIPERYKDNMRLWITEALPATYPGKLQPGEPRRTALLSVLWPGLEPKSELNRAEFEVLGHGRRISILIQALPIADDVFSGYMERVYSGATDRALYLGEAQELSQIGQRYGLDIRDLSPEAAARYLVNQRKQSDQTYLNEQVFVASDPAGKHTTIIRCTHESIPDDRPNGAPLRDGPLSTSCQHKFSLPELQAGIQLSYSRKYLPDWAAIEVQVRTLLISFVEKS
jgi:hypothetical protein